jgi:hypothetical protein
MVTRTVREDSPPAAGPTGDSAHRRPRVQLQEAPPEEAPPTGTSAQRLARALGTEVGVDDAGNASVELPGPGDEPFVPFSTAPRTVTRLIDGEPQAPAAFPPDGKPEAGEVDVDEIAETVIDKLRRELLIEREQSGGSMDLI